MKPNSSSRKDASEKMLRRQEWKREQERQRQHEKLKQKKIYEYEMKRACEKDLPSPKPPNRTKSRSKSPRSRPRRSCTSFSSPNIPNLSAGLKSADGTVPLFKGHEGTKINAAELRKIKVDIRRNIPGKSTDSDLQRDIINPEDVVVKRRTVLKWEGLKPIFERKEIKGVVTKTEEVEEHCTVTANNDSSVGKSKTFKNHSTSLSPIRSRNHSSHRTLCRHSSLSSTSQGYEKQKKCVTNTDKLYVPDRKRMLGYANHHRDERSHRDQREYRKRSRERSRERYREHVRDRKDKDRSREQTVSSQQYIGHVPFPIYYSHFPPRPMMMLTFMPHGRHPPMMGPLRPFPPRFGPSNPSCGPMF